MTHLCVILSLFAFCLTDYNGMFTFCLVLTNFLTFDYLSKGFILYGCFSIKFCSISWYKKSAKKQGSRFCYGMFTLCPKVSSFQNEFMKSSFLPRYKQKNVRVSALCIEGRNLDGFCSHFERNDDFINSFWN